MANTLYTHATKNLKTRVHTSRFKFRVKDTAVLVYPGIYKGSEVTIDRRYLKGSRTYYQVSFKFRNKVVESFIVLEKYLFELVTI